MPYEYKSAPDGGPLSNAQIGGQRRFKQVRVRKKGVSEARTFLVREEAYDPELHIRVDESGKDVAPVKEPPPAPKEGTETKEQLLTLTIPQLKELPEFAKVEGKPTAKADIVDAILAVREAAAAK